MDKLPKMITRAEAAALLCACNIKTHTGLRNRCMLEVMYRCGLRVSEVCGLEPGHIITADSMIEVRDGKGGSDRTVPFCAMTGRLLDAWAGKRNPNAPTFFHTGTLTPCSPRYCQQMIQRMAKRVGLTVHVTPHVLRHTYATELLAEGFSIRDVQVLLGHKHVNTTQIYTHVRPHELAEKIQKRAC